MALVGQPQGQKFYARVKINDIEIQAQNIISLTIREWVFDVLPRIEIKMVNAGYILETMQIEDGDVIDVIIAKHDEDPNPLEMKFLLCDHYTVPEGDNRKLIVSVSGILKVSDMFFPIKTRSFSKSSSVDIFQTIANEANITFTNPDNVTANDIMNWYQINSSNFTFIKHVLKRANVTNDAVFFYTNSKNNFVYTTLKTNMRKKEVGIARYDVEKFGATILDDQDTNKTMWFNGYDIANSSSYYNKKIGYGTNYTYIGTDGTINKADYSDKSKMTNMLFRNKDAEGQAVLNRTYGMNNDLNLYDTSYFEALIRNKYLRDTFFSCSVVININALCQVNLFDKVNLVLPSILDNKMSDPYSGLYLVCGITHSIVKNGIYQKMLSLHRNGMNNSVVRKDNILVE